MRSFRGRFGTSRAFCTVPASLFAASPSLLRRRRPWSGGQRGCKLNDAICSQSICFWEGGRSACGGVWLPPKLLLKRPLVRGRRESFGASFLQSHWGFFEYLRLSGNDCGCLPVFEGSESLSLLRLQKRCNAPEKTRRHALFPACCCAVTAAALVRCSLYAPFEPSIKIPRNWLW